jgi:hypothetical protein
VNEAEQDVLGPDEAVVQKARFLLSQDQHPARPIGESLEHVRIVPPTAWRECARSESRGDQAFEPDPFMARMEAYGAPCSIRE